MRIFLCLAIILQTKYTPMMMSKKQFQELWKLATAVLSDQRGVCV